VHFHSLAYHITVVPADSPWGSTAISTAAAALAAPLAACDDQVRFVHCGWVKSDQ
jgi:hypothetical protein